MKKDYQRTETVCFTGHRNIPSEESAYVERSVAEAVRKAYEDGFRTFLCGGARGFDTIAAETVLRFRLMHPDVQLIIAVPCASQADKWPAAEKRRYSSVLADADEVITLSENYYSGCMQTRNRYMVDRASLCLCYLIRFEGGTWSTVRYALHEGLTVRNLAMHGSGSNVMKENAWNFICTYRSAQKSVSIVHLSHTRPEKSRRTDISKRLSGKLRSVGKNSPSP